MACYSLSRLSNDSKPAQEVLAKFQRDCKKGIAKEAAQHITVEQVLKTFEESHVACMPLKGYLLKYLYPRPDMRLMTDVDILLNNKQTKRVKMLLSGMGLILYCLAEHIQTF